MGTSAWCAARGRPCPIAGRSLRHPASALSMLPARRHPGSAGQQRRLPGTGSPSLATVMHRSGDTSHPRDTSHPKSPERERGDGRRPRNRRGGSQRWIHSLALVASWRSELAHPGCEVVTGAVRSHVNRLFSRIFRSFRGVRPVFRPRPGDLGHPAFSRSGRIFSGFFSLFFPWFRWFFTPTTRPCRRLARGVLFPSFVATPREALRGREASPET